MEVIEVSEQRKARIDRLEWVLKDIVDCNTADLEILREQLLIEEEVKEKALENVSRIAIGKDLDWSVIVEVLAFTHVLERLSSLVVSDV